MDLVTDTHEHKRCHDNVEERLIWNQDKNTFSVVCEPDVVLRYEQLKEKRKTEKMYVREDE